MKLFDLKPPPDILVALTHTPMKPIDALCEFIDNAIDSFSNKKEGLQGINEINIDLPTMAELQRDEGVIRVTDNGPGMTDEDAAKALTAGYSSQKVYGRLGMFGLGLNIAAGKFARKTRLITATKNSEKVVVVEVDLDKLVEQNHYEVQPYEESKDEHFKEHGSGTIIELTDWWHPGGPNSENPKKLIQHGPGGIRTILGRRYATLLRSDANVKFKIRVKGNACEPFEHCVWDKHRFVKRSNGQVYARQIFDKTLRTEIRCMECGELVLSQNCPRDSSHPVTSIEERVHGWVGVQRFDDNDHFGIDLIRNGRAIRIFEKAAFFSFEHDDGENKTEYPLDGTYGRIVGEVHLDHVRVHFNKQDFNRYTPEWQRAMEFIRGASLLKSQQRGDTKNDSPVMKIFTAYRKIRKVGLGDMYMGVRKPGDTGPKRISRETEKEFRKRFENKEPGYYDDKKWWEKVEEASHEPDTVEQCPECEFQNPITEEVCQGCQRLLKSKECIDCKEKIPLSAPKCEHCGKSQVPEGPWECGVCKSKNLPDIDECQQCGKPKGSIHPFALETLLDNSSKDENLSLRGVEIDFHNGGSSKKFDLDTHIAKLHVGNLHLPIIVYPDIPDRKLYIFIDKNHYLFSSLQLCPEHAISAEAASFIQNEAVLEMPDDQKRQHNLSVLQSMLLKKYWENDVSDNPEQVRQDMNSLLEDIRTKIAANISDIAEEIFNSMSTSEVNSMVSNMQESNVDISEMKKLKEQGEFVFYVSPETVISIFQQYPEKFFDEKVWNVPWNISDIPEENVKTAQKQIKENHLNCLEDGISFLRYTNPPPIVVHRTRLSIEFLQQNLAD